MLGEHDHSAEWCHQNRGCEKSVKNIPLHRLNLSMWDATVIPSRARESMQPPPTTFLPPLPRRPEPASAESGPRESNPKVVSANSIITGQMPLVRVPRLGNQNESAHPETIESQITAYYYMALTNILCQAHVPHVQHVEDDDPVKTLIEASYRDFQVIDGWLAGLDVHRIRATPSARLYREVQDSWRHHVKDWRMISLTEKRDTG